MTAIVQIRLAITAVLLLMLSVIPAATAQSMGALVSVPPLAWLVDEIAGDTASVTVMVPEGHVPEASQPSPATLLQVRDADVVILVGHPAFTFESKFVLPQLTEQQQASSISLYRIAKKLYTDTAIENEDPHLWTSPILVREAARQLTVLLSELDPDNAGLFRQRYAAVNKQLDQLIVRFRRMAVQRGSKRFIVYHPAWGSIERDFGLEQISIEHEGKSPGPAAMSRMLDDLRLHGDKLIITSPGHAQRDAAVIVQQLDGTIATVDPLQRNWLIMMENMFAALAGGDGK